MKLLRPFNLIILTVASAMFITGGAAAGEAGAQAWFEQVKGEPTLLRGFLYDFPKGGDLHNHLDGAVYAESYIRWAAEDGKCIDLESFVIISPPCNAETGRPAVQDIRYDSSVVNRIIDAFSVRNYERRPVSGHDQFFSTFRRFAPAGVLHEGDMLAEASARAAGQNIIYLELMQSYGMAEARQLAADNKEFHVDTPLSRLIRHGDIEELAATTIKKLDRVERQWRETLSCDQATVAPGCDVAIRYLAQVIRVFPPEQVLAQTLLAFHLIEKDPRYVGLNFVAPEDHPVALRDYRRQMEMIGELAGHFPGTENGITLHAGEVVMGLVPPEHLGWHIRAAIEVAGARRIGHGIDIFYDTEARQLMERMAERDILVEINLTSNDVILGIKGDRHPLKAYRKYGVPIALSTDDEGVSRIDLTHEYQRAVETYEVSYADLKYLSRNALAYSFLEGRGLLESTRAGKFAGECEGAEPGGKPISKSCRKFLAENKKAELQWELEKRFKAFEMAYD